MSNTIFTIPAFGNNQTIIGKKVMVHDMSAPSNASTWLYDADLLGSVFIGQNVAGLTPQAYGAGGILTLDAQTHDLIWNELIDPNNSLLRTENGNYTVDWANCQLSANFSSGDACLDWNNGSLISADTFEETLNWFEKILYSNGNQSLDWQYKILLDDNGNQSLDWQYKILLDDNGYQSLDWQYKILSDDNGNNRSLDWNNRGLYGINGNNVIDWQNGIMVSDFDGELSINWYDRKLYDSSGNEILDWSSSSSLFSTVESVSNKSTNTSLGTSDILYPSQKAVKTYVDNNLPYKEYVAIIGQQSTNSPSEVSVIFNNTGLTFSYGRIGVGQFVIFPSTAVPNANKVVAFFTKKTPFVDIALDIEYNNQFKFYSGLNGTPTDGLIYDRITIKIYN